MNKLKIKISLLIIMLLLIPLAFSQKTFALDGDHYDFYPYVQLYGSSDGSTYTKIPAIWTQYNGGYYLDLDATGTLSNGLLAGDGYDYYKITGLQTSLTLLRFDASVYNIDFDINQKTLFFSFEYNSSTDDYTFEITQNGITELFTLTDAYISIYDNEVAVTGSYLTYYEKGLEEGQAIAQETPTQNPIVDTNSDGFDDVSFSAGRLDALNEVDGAKTLVGFAGSILGAGLSFFLFLATQFDIFGVTLLSVILISFAVGLSIFLIKKIF